MTPERNVLPPVLARLGDDLEGAVAHQINSGRAHATRPFARRRRGRSMALALPLVLVAVALGVAIAASTGDPAGAPATVHAATGSSETDSGATDAGAPDATADPASEPPATPRVQTFSGVVPGCGPLPTRSPGPFLCSLEDAPAAAADPPGHGADDDLVTACIEADTRWLCMVGPRAATVATLNDHVQIVGR